ncbi:MAG: NADH-quinone oxidoreductase subunit C [Bryobacteraceae bacterium]
MLPEQDIKETRVVQALEQTEPGAVLGGKLALGELTLEVPPDRILGVCRALKADQYVRLASVTCVDWYPMEPRFEIVYHLHSIARNERLRLSVRVDSAHPEIDSVHPVWRAADWYEREVFDMFGVRFRNHPNLTRILMPEDWEGNPLRKDYPVHGHKYSYQNE